MGSVIQTNVSSLNSQRNLYSSNNALSTSFQRLSSGLRINSARDDAAGLQLSNRLTAQIGGLNQAARNANDGISLAQTAEGALQESTNLLLRIRDLSVQSASGSLGSSERAALQQEVGQLQSELNRIADTTAFGGTNLLDGTFGSRSFQVGSSSNESVAISIGSARGDSVGLNSLVLNANAPAATLATAATAGFGAIAIGGGTAPGFGSTATTAGDGSQFVRNVGLGVTAAITATGTAAFSITGGLGRAEITVALTTAATLLEAVDLELNAGEIAAAVNRFSSDSGVTADARTIIQLGGALDAGGEDLLEEGTYTLRLYGDNAVAVDVAASVTDSYDLSGLADAINATTSETGVIAIAEGASVTLINENGSNIGLGNIVFVGAETTVTNSSFNIKTLNYAGTRAIATNVSFTAGTATGTGFQASGQVQLNGGASAFNVANANSLAGHLTTATNDASSLQSATSIDISTAASAQNAINIVDGALASIDATRASLGAVQNRFNSTISNLQNISENASASRSRIRDTDYAAETAELAKNQVLQQAGLSILAQANSSAQSVLSLLQ